MAKKSKSKSTSKLKVKFNSNNFLWFLLLFFIIISMIVVLLYVCDLNNSPSANIPATNSVKVVYADWCPHCKKFVPAAKAELDGKVINGYKITFVEEKQMSGMLSPQERALVKGFPTFIVNGLQKNPPSRDAAGIRALCSGGSQNTATPPSRPTPPPRPAHGDAASNSVKVVYADWCPHCKSFVPEAKAQLDGKVINGHKVIFVEEKQISEMLSPQEKALVKGFPMFFVNGVGKNPPSRDIPGIKSLCNSKLLASEEIPLPYNNY